ncbi:protein FAM166A isoform X1 [Vidua macroura]|uniref:protein FAM166A isoform X1 n=1 Tax=Vidua macroura TaxID=187451 RepID=UPI0023A8D61E|nr:protein FAM166A isoform X1 [Vidua macroura]
MAVCKGNSLFPRNPYYIPGYGGYVPQFIFKSGDTYGRTTHNLLTDPNIRKSPRSLLAPLDNKENLLEFHYHIEHPGYVTFQPITSPPEVPLGPQPVPTPVLAEPMVTGTEPGHWRCPPGAPGARQAWLPPEPLRGLALHPEAQELEREVAKPPLAGVLGKGTGTCQCNCGGSKTQLETGGVALPGGVATADYPLPVLPVPNAIRQKVILGYTGYIPCSMDNVGMTYLLSVKKAMEEFDRRQLLERNPPYTLGTRFPLTHWPDTKIYSRAGLIPNYTGFVPYLQDTCGLTYGDSTRESYRCEQRRRGRAL